jgi:hypothetical protein
MIGSRLAAGPLMDSATSERALTTLSDLVWPKSSAPDPPFGAADARCSMIVFPGQTSDSVPSGALADWRG